MPKSKPPPKPKGQIISIEDVSLNDLRELFRLKRLLQAKYYLEHQRPAILAEIEKLRALLENEPTQEAKEVVRV